MIVSSNSGLFGPYARVEVMSDRLRVWVTTHSNPADLPVSVIGAYEVVDPELPPDFSPESYLWYKGELVPKQA